MRLVYVYNFINLITDVPSFLALMVYPCVRLQLSPLYYILHVLAPMVLFTVLQPRIILSLGMSMVHGQPTL